MFTDMFTDKEGKEIGLDEVISYLTGTDDADFAQSVIDFALYEIKEGGEIAEDPMYYLVAAETIVTMISFNGPFVMVELDFRNIGLDILNQVMEKIQEFHRDVTIKGRIMLSTITSMDSRSKYSLSLFNPLLCVRGFSSESKASSLVQLVYSAENIAFIEPDVDYKKIEEEVQREAAAMKQLQGVEVSEEEVQAMEESMGGAGLDDMFKPQFGLDMAGSAGSTAEETKRISGEAIERIRIGSDNKGIDRRNRIRSSHRQDDGE